MREMLIDFVLWCIVLSVVSVVGAIMADRILGENR